MKHNEHIKGCRKDYCGSGDSCNDGIYLCPICSSKQADIKQGYAQALEDVKKRIETHHYSNTDHIKWLKQQIAKLGKEKQ